MNAKEKKISRKCDYEIRELWDWWETLVAGNSTNGQGKGKGEKSQLTKGFKKTQTKYYLMTHHRSGHPWTDLNTRFQLNVLGNVFPMERFLPFHKRTAWTDTYGAPRHTPEAYLSFGAQMWFTITWKWRPRLTESHLTLTLCVRSCFRFRVVPADAATSSAWKRALAVAL